ncbi:ROK family protein [Paenibacillus pasadenensis]|uniref:ROK family protein n=1 Tax=Paenibacillus pasadenensis TaxID=217090 RepID=UPI00204030C6|nr:ROK family protein [Paenibacillus pasadenensis]MCM3749381.1 ROK family protein [Paenibacillus pasadenensis]
MKLKAVIALDVGGTFIKSCLVIDRLPLPASRMQLPALSDRSEDEIVEQWLVMIQRHFQFCAEQFGEKAAAEAQWSVGLAFPGPFNYEDGISLIQGLGKFEALYGRNLKQALRLRLEQSEGGWAEALRSADIRFAHDARMFALGVGASFPNERLIALTLGTGLGSAFIDPDGDEPPPGIPANGWLYNEPYRGGIVDDAFSSRGLLWLAEEHGVLLPGMDVKELAAAARIGGDDRCKKVFDEFGRRLAEMMIPYIQAFQPGIIAFGGQISNCYDLFGASLRVCWKSNKLEVNVHIPEDLLEPTFIGLFRLSEQQ